MSDRPCNRCDYERIRARAERAGRKVEAVVVDTGPWRGWVEVRVDGEPAGVTYMELPATCACDS